MTKPLSFDDALASLGPRRISPPGSHDTYLKNPVVFSLIRDGYFRRQEDRSITWPTIIQSINLCLESRGMPQLPSDDGTVSRFAQKQFGPQANAPQRTQL